MDQYSHPEIEELMKIEENQKCFDCGIAIVKFKMLYRQLQSEMGFTKQRHLRLFEMCGLASQFWHQCEFHTIANNRCLGRQADRTAEERRKQTLQRLPQRISSASQCHNGLQVHDQSQRLLSEIIKIRSSQCRTSLQARYHLRFRNAGV